MIDGWLMLGKLQQEAIAASSTAGYAKLHDSSVSDPHRGTLTVLASAIGPQYTIIDSDCCDPKHKLKLGLLLLVSATTISRFPPTNFFWPTLQTKFFVNIYWWCASEWFCIDNKMSSRIFLSHNSKLDDDDSIADFTCLNSSGSKAAKMSTISSL